MINRYAIIKNGVITNVILVDLEKWSPSDGSLILPEEDAISQGYTWGNEISTRKIWNNSSEFLAEFTLEETAQISLSTNPVIAALRLVLLSWIGEIWSDDERIKVGINTLVEENIIDQVRADSILLI